MAEHFKIIFHGGRAGCEKEITLQFPVSMEVLCDSSGADLSESNLIFLESGIIAPVKRSKNLSKGSPQKTI
jgi:hypothetical protein